MVWSCFLYGQVKTNYQIITEQSEVILDSLMKSLPDSAKNIELGMNNLYPERRSFMINTIGRIAGKYNKTVSLESGNLKIDFQQMEIRPVYNEESLKLLGLNKKIRRELGLSLSGYVKDLGSGTIKSIFDSEKKFEDIISSSDISNLEKSPYTFTRGSFENKLKWTKYIEPGIVVASVSVLIYLFYSMRY